MKTIEMSFKCTVWQDVSITVTDEQLDMLKTLIKDGTVTDIESLESLIGVEVDEVTTDFDSMEFLLPSENFEQSTVVISTEFHETSNA